MSLRSLALKYRRLIIIAIHLALVICAYILAFYVRLDFKIDSNYWGIIIRTLPILLAINDRFVTFKRV